MSVPNDVHGIQDVDHTGKASGRTLAQYNSDLAKTGPRKLPKYVHISIYRSSFISMPDGVNHANTWRSFSASFQMSIQM